MSTRAKDITVTTKHLPAVHLAVASGVSASFDSTDIQPVIEPLYPELLGALSSARVEIAGRSISYYDDTVDGGIGVHAGFPVDECVTEVPGLEVVDLAEVPLAATAIYRGDMATVDIDTVGAALRMEWRQQVPHHRVLARALPRMPRRRHTVANRDSVPDRADPYRLSRAFTSIVNQPTLPGSGPPSRPTRSVRCL